MDKASISFLEVEKKLMQDKKFRNEYEKNKLYYKRVFSNIKEKITFLEASGREVLLAAKRCNKKYKKALQKLSR